MNPSIGLRSHRHQIQTQRITNTAKWLDMFSASPYGCSCYEITTSSYSAMSDKYIKVAFRSGALDMFYFHSMWNFSLDINAA